MRNPRISPRPGDRLAKIVTHRNGVRVTNSRTVIQRDRDLITFTPRRLRQKCWLANWRKWAKNAQVMERGSQKNCKVWPQCACIVQGRERDCR